MERLDLGAIARHTRRFGQDDGIVNDLLNVGMYHVRRLVLITFPALSNFSCLALMGVRGLHGGGSAVKTGCVHLKPVSGSKSPWHSYTVISTCLYMQCVRWFCGKATCRDAAQDLCALLQQRARCNEFLPVENSL